jgi:hypothetical protein
MSEEFAFVAGRRLPHDQAYMPRLGDRDVGVMVDVGGVKVRIIPVIDAKTDQCSFRVDVFGPK